MYTSTLSFTLQTSGQQHSISVHLPLFTASIFYIYLFLRWIILFLNHICLLRSHKPTDKETSEEPRCGSVERLSNSKQSAKHKNNYNQFDSCVSVSYSPSAHKSTLTSKKSQHLGGPEDKVQNQNQTHDKRLKEGWSKTEHKIASPWLALAHGPKILIRTQSSLWSDWKRPYPDELSGQREI